MRVFVAVELSEAVREHLVGVQEILRPVAGKASWTRPENLHLTLKFLGEVPDGRLAELTDVLGSVASPPVELRAVGMECFPSNGRVRIVGAALGGDDALLGEVQRAVEEACHGCGYPREGQAFRAHVTLARAKAPLAADRRVAMASATARLWPGPPMLAEQFVLMESRLAASGPTYLPAARLNLRGG